MALMCLSPLSWRPTAVFPHRRVRYLLVPNPILESQLLQSFSLFPRMSILAFELELEFPTALKPSMLQSGCKEACEPISVFHVLRPSEVAQYRPSAISEHREFACLFTTMGILRFSRNGEFPLIKKRQKCHILDNG